MSDYCPLIKDECRWQDCVLVFNKDDDDFCDFQKAYMSILGMREAIDLVVGKLQGIIDRLDEIDKSINGIGF